MTTIQVPGRLYPIQLEYCPASNVQYLQPQVLPCAYQTLVPFFRFFIIAESQERSRPEKLDPKPYLRIMQRIDTRVRKISILVLRCISICGGDGGSAVLSVYHYASYIHEPLGLVRRVPQLWQQKSFFNQLTLVLKAGHLGAYIAQLFAQSASVHLRRLQNGFPLGLRVAVEDRTTCMT